MAYFYIIRFQIKDFYGSVIKMHCFNNLDFKSINFIPYLVKKKSGEIKILVLGMGISQLTWLVTKSKSSLSTGQVLKVMQRFSCRLCENHMHSLSDWHVRWHWLAGLLAKAPRTVPCKGKCVFDKMSF